MVEWLVENYDLVGLIWAAIVAILEALKRAIPGTKDDTVIVKIIDIGGKILTFGASNLLPNQDGVTKEKNSDGTGGTA